MLHKKIFVFFQISLLFANIFIIEEFCEFLSFGPISFMTYLEAKSMPQYIEIMV